MDISMDIHEKSVDMDMDMDVIFHIHGNPDYCSRWHETETVSYDNSLGYAVLDGAVGMVWYGIV